MYSYIYGVITKKYQGHLFPTKKWNRLVLVTFNKEKLHVCWQSCIWILQWRNAWFLGSISKTRGSKKFSKWSVWTVAKCRTLDLFHHFLLYKSTCILNLGKRTANPNNWKVTSVFYIYQNEKFQVTQLHYSWHTGWDFYLLSCGPRMGEQPSIHIQQWPPLKMEGNKILDWWKNLPWSFQWLSSRDVPGLTVDELSRHWFISSPASQMAGFHSFLVKLPVKKVKFLMLYFSG